jgi:membrane protease YdiL (CAAX protease family)
MRALTIFVAGAAVSIVLAIVAGGMLMGMAGGLAPMHAAALVSALICAQLLALSAVILRRDSSSLRVLGLPGNRRRAGELAAGFAITAVLFAGVAWLQSRMIGAGWDFQGLTGVSAALAALPLVAVMVLAEELLFRGVALRCLRAAARPRVAIAVTAIAFGLYHLIGSGTWAMGAFFQFVLPCIGGALFAWAAIRSEGLSLPIGLHLGGNWVQASVAAFRADSAPDAAADAIWRIPISAADLQFLTAPDVLQKLPYLAACTLAGVMTWALLEVSHHAKDRSRF